MFYGFMNNPSGLTVKELIRYLEYVNVYGGGDSIVYASSKPVTFISCEPDCVLMETTKTGK